MILRTTTSYHVNNYYTSNTTLCPKQTVKNAAWWVAADDFKSSAIWVMASCLK